MNKERILSLVRTALTIIGSLLVGNVIFGHPVTNEWLDSGIGGLMFVGSVVWGIVDKTATLEMFTSALAKIITFGGGILVAKGIIKADTLVLIISLIAVLGPELWKLINRMKSQAIATGKLGISDLKGVSAISKTESIKPVINTPKP